MDETVEQKAENFKHIQYLYQVTHPKPICDFPPDQMWVETTNRCNLKCKMCIQHKMTRPKGMMKLSLMKKIIDEASEFNPFFDFCRQGEPLMHPDIVEILNYATKEGLTKTRMITNGTLLRGDVVDGIINSGLKKLSISFNGYDKESFNRIQQGADFDVCMRNIKTFLKRKFELGSDAPEVEISLVEYEELKGNTEKFIALFQDMPINRIRTGAVINFFGSNKSDAEGANPNWFDDPPSHIEYPSCKVPFRFMNISWNGDVTPCIIDYDNIYTVGNIENSSLLGEWNSSLMQEFRHLQITKNFNKIEKKCGHKFCKACSNLWSSPLSNGPQYPSTFEYGMQQFFDKTKNKTMAGGFKKDVFRTSAEAEEMWIKHENKVKREC